MNAPRTKRDAWLPLAAGAVLLIVLVITAVAILQRDEPDENAPLSAEAREQLTEARDAADFYIRSDQLPKARVILERLIERHPDDSETNMLMAKLLMAEGHVQAASAHAERSTELADSDHEAHFISAILAEANGHFEKAREHYAAASTLAPEDARYAMYLAQSLIRLNQLEDAQIQLLRAQRLDASLHQTYAMHAEIAARRGNVETALERVEKALDLVHDDRTRHRMNYTVQKAELLRRANRPQAAQELLLRLPPREQQQQRVVEQLARGYLMMNQPDRAAAVWAELFALEPTNARAAAEAGMAFLRAGRADHARQYHEMARQLSTSDHTVVALEEALQNAE